MGHKESSRNIFSFRGVFGGRWFKCRSLQDKAEVSNYIYAMGNYAPRVVVDFYVICNDETQTLALDPPYANCLTEVA